MVTHTGDNMYELQCLPAGAGEFSLLHCTDLFWVPHSLVSNGYRALSPGEKGTSLKLTTPIHISAEVKNITSSHISILPHIFMAW
jgi:hypothetical protein